MTVECPWCWLGLVANPVVYGEFMTPDSSRSVARSVEEVHGLEGMAWGEYGTAWTRVRRLVGCPVCESRGMVDEATASDALLRGAR